MPSGSDAAALPGWKPWAAVVLVQFLFGALPAISKFAIGHVSPLVIVLCRSATALVVLGLLAALRRGTLARVARFPLGLHARIAALGLLGVSFNQILLFFALSKTTAAASSILAPNISAVALVVSLALGRERFTWPKAANIALGTAGVCVLFLPHLDASALRGEAMVGNLLCLASTVCYGCYLALSSRVIGRAGAVAFSALAFAWATAFNLVLYGALSGNAPWDFPAAIAATAPGLPASFWWSLSYVVVGATVLTYMLNSYALASLAPGFVSGLVCSQTLIGVALSSGLVGESVPPEYYLAMVLILTGVIVLWISNLRETQRAKSKDPAMAAMDSI